MTFTIRVRRRRLRVTPTLVVLSLVALIIWPSHPATAGGPDTATPASRTPVRHFVYVMQGDRTFDNYFGTFPGADGIPADVCQPRVLGRPQSGCVRPFPLRGQVPANLAPGTGVVQAQIDNGRMDGFVAAYHRQGRDGTAVMGYYDEQDLPYYWSLARQYVLFDRFFAAAPYGIRLNRSYWVSAAPDPPSRPSVGYGDLPTIFDRLRRNGVSWKFYVQDYTPTETFRLTGSAARSGTGAASGQTARVPLLNFGRFLDDPELRSRIVDLDQYYRDLDSGQLPAVSYIATANASERSARTAVAGQRLVQGLLNHLMLSPTWSDSAFLLSYDGSGGWYDHVAPPKSGPESLGLRVPALLVSPFARSGAVDHTTVDCTSALRFIEDNWGLPALTRRDATAGSLLGAFDFAAAPRQARLFGAEQISPLGQFTNSGPVYGLYGGAVLIAAGTVTVALALGRRRRKDRRESWRDTVEVVR